jgi:hypothetical protein
MTHSPHHIDHRCTSRVISTRAFLRALCSLSAALLLAACGSDGNARPGATPTPTAAADTRRYLFLLYSDGGELLAQGDGSYVFRLHDVWDTVVAFTDRPFRDAASTPLHNWIDNWSANGFAEQPPNAAVTMLIDGSVQVTDWAILTLTAPRFTASGALEFTARFLTLPNGEPAFFPTQAGSGVKASFSTTQVFLDSVGSLGAPPTATPTLRACAEGQEHDTCQAAFCGDAGKGGCCTTTSPPACFNPAAPASQPGWIGFTACGQDDKRALACVLSAPPVPTPTSTATPGASTPTATNTPSGPTSTATDTPTGAQPTATPTQAPGSIRRCAPADPGGKACRSGTFKRCQSDGDCGADGPCVENIGGCLRDCKGKHCCTASGACWDADDENACSFSGLYPNGCYADGACRDDVVCDARDVAPAQDHHSITIVNTTSETIWVGGLTGGSNPSPVDVGSWDWELAAGASHTITVPIGWDSGRLWPRTQCSAGPGANELHCKTGDCKGLRTCEVSGDPPAILAEMTLDGGANPGQPDNYNASAVDGWNNIVVTIEPLVTGNFPGQWCGIAGCTGAPECPTGYMAKYAPDGTVLGCLSPCKAPGADPDTRAKLCCTCSLSDSCTCGDACCNNQFGCSPYYPAGDPPASANAFCVPTGSITREEDGQTINRPESKWDDKYLAYIDNFHAACPGTYAWQFDDLNNLFRCENTPGSLLDYKVTFHSAPVQ